MQPLAETYECIGKVDVDSYKQGLEECQCRRVNVFGCRVNASATGCDGRCQDPQKLLGVQQLQSSLQNLETATVETGMHINILQERASRLVLLRGGTPTASGYQMPRTEANTLLDNVQVVLNYLQSHQENLNSMLASAYRNAASQQEAGSADSCLPTLVHQGSGRVLQCGCRDPTQAGCKPTPDRKACQQQCPASTVQPCKVAQDASRIGQPGVDKHGRFCQGGCDGRTSTCTPVLNSKGYIEGCVCKVSDVRIDDAASKGQHCLPAKTEGDFVLACRCNEGCRVSRDTAMAGRQDLGYDSDGLFCNGMTRSEEPKIHLALIFLWFCFFFLTKNSFLCRRLRRDWQTMQASL